MNAKSACMRLLPLWLCTTLFFFFSIIHSSAQGKKVSGTVTDDNGTPLSNVSVLVKGTNRGSYTDSTGIYTITVSGSNDVLVFSYVNMLSQELKAGDNATLNVQLKTNPKSTLGEVVVVGYGTQKKTDLTGAVASIGRKDIVNKPFTSPDQALAGRVAGVNITNRSGDPGAPIEVRIRGVGTVGNNQPLWVIDGVPIVITSNISVNTASYTESNPLSSINPADIESIDILKDASAAAIYGARAANGVVIVTTKRGKEGRVSLVYNGSVGALSVPDARRYKVLDVPQYVDFQSKLGRDFSAFANKPFVDWQDAIFQNAIANNHNLSVSGGTKNLNFNVGAGYQQQGGMERGQDFRRISLKINSDAKVGERLKFGEAILISSTDRLTQSEGGNFAGFAGSRNTPYYQIYNDSDALGYNPSNAATRGSGASATNYVWLTDTRYNATKVHTKALIGSIYGELEIIKDLKYRLTAGVNYNIGDGTFFQAATNVDYGSGTRSSLLVQERPIEQTTTLAHTLTYHKTLGKHDFTILAGEEETNFSYNKMRIQGRDLFNNNVMLPSVATTVASANEADHWALRGFLGRVNYSFNDRYLFTFNVRRDLSSRFSEAHRSGNFPSFSAGWRVSEENFMKSVSFINDMKIRGSWGQSGNQFTGSNFAYLPSLQTTIFYVIGNDQHVVRGPAPVIFANSNLKWETSNQLDFGLDLTMLNRKLDVTFDYYNKTSHDVLLSLPIPMTSGYFLPADANVGSIRNSGIELSANYRNQVGAFSYSIGANIATVKNEVLSLGSIKEIVSGVSGAQTHRTTVGRPLGYFYGFETGGLYQNAGDVAKGLPDTYSSGASPGDIRFVDVNNDGKVDASDRTYLGSPIPKYTYGVQLSVAYKGIDISLSSQGRGDVQVYNQARTNLEDMASGNNQTVSVLDRWTSEGTSNSMPRATSTDPNANQRYSSRWIENGAFFKIKNLQIGYTIPAAGLRKITQEFISSSRFYVGLTNLAVFTKYSGYDPEVTRGASYQKGEFPLASGQDAGGSPQPFIAQFGWQIGF